MESHFTNPSKPTPKHVCRKCSEYFKSNNALHHHLRGNCDAVTQSTASIPESKQISTSEPKQTSSSGSKPASISRSIPKQVIIRSDATDVCVEGYSFRGYHYVTVPVSLSEGGLEHDLCADTGATASLIDREFLRAEYPEAAITRMPTPMTVKGIGESKHDASEYAKVRMFLKGEVDTGNPATAMIEREFHIVDDLAAKALIGIDILKPERVAIDLNDDSMKIGSCSNLKVPIKVKIRGRRISASVYAKARTTIPAHSSFAVLISGARRRQLKLPKDRDFIFEPEVLDSLSPCAHIVDASISRVFVRNDTDHDVVLARNTNLGKVAEYKLAGCFPISTHNQDLATKVPGRQLKQKQAHTSIRRLLATAAAFTAAITAPAANEAAEVVHPTGVTVYRSTAQSTASISATQAGFPKQKSQQPILFLSRLLTEAETRYWPTELEVAGLVWVVKRIRHMLEATLKPTTIIYTDHLICYGRYPRVCLALGHRGDGFVS